jgi:biopolymer transport protein TolQ
VRLHLTHSPQKESRLPGTAGLSTSVLDPILSAGPLARFVLGVLLFFSVICWALIVEKFWEFRAIKRESRAFTKAFRESRRFSLLYTAAKRFRWSPLAALYTAAGHELASVYGGVEAVDAALDEGEGLPRETLDAVHRAMRRASDAEVGRMERYLPFLALFGTVVGIMNAFHNIGQQGSANLAVVAPGISEALIATAAGLGAAIPAVMAYNFFVNRSKRWATEMDGFMLELLNVLARPTPHKAVTR